MHIKYKTWYTKKWNIFLNAIMLFFLMLKYCSLSLIISASYHKSLGPNLQRDRVPKKSIFASEVAANTLQAVSFGALSLLALS